MLLGVRAGSLSAWRGCCRGTTHQTWKPSGMSFKVSNYPGARRPVLAANEEGRIFLSSVLRKSREKVPVAFPSPRPIFFDRRRRIHRSPCIFNQCVFSSFCDYFFLQRGLRMDGILNIGLPATRGFPAAAIFSLEPSRSIFPRFGSMTQARGAIRGPSFAYL
ncbi:hypothetical protein CDAR_623031 [Caerostris darwini]|uniref:Secreted protein n=1 Tax=Caerostris darwini TaxID=1538125 RepID=A0AAV4U9H7_9ARAC|nr:hypothetical protein CDAR_623031 [Caerostris darwini]